MTTRVGHQVPAVIHMKDHQIIVSAIPIANIICSFKFRLECPSYFCDTDSDTCFIFGGEILLTVTAKVHGWMKILDARQGTMGMLFLVKTSVFVT